MEKNNWKSIHLTKTAKLYAHNDVFWSDFSGSIKEGKVSQIMSDKVVVKGVDGSLYIINMNQLTKKKRL